jgi:RNA polymerase sigma-70 factor (ECF subfamily)
MTDSDASLLERTRAGDLLAADVLLRRHFRMCYLIAFGASGDRADAEDICQEALIKAMEHIDECRDASAFRSWLAAVVRNVAHNRRRYLLVRRAEPLDDHSTRPEYSRTDVDVAERSELRERIMSALARLTTVQRQVVLLHDLEGEKHKDVARQLGISETMSRRHLSDARIILRRLLKKYTNSKADRD